MGKILAVDYGTKRLGLAVSDPGQTWAFGRGTVEVFSDAEAMAKITELAEAEDAELVVVGLPLDKESGQPQAMAEQVKKFGQQLERHLGRPIEYIDERLSSSAAKKQAQEAGRRGSDPVDERSAILLLESFLTRRGS